MRLTQRKGDTAVAQAIATFTKIGYDVLLPLTESSPYDLVVDTGGKLQKVQVRFSTNGEVDLRRVHSNSHGYVIKKAKKGAYDWLYILTGAGSEYLIEGCLSDRRSITPTEKHLLKKAL